MALKCYAFGVFAVSLAVLLSGCIQESAPLVNLGTISQYVDKQVTAEGCLSFNCPTSVGSSYPKDCMVTLCDEHKKCINNLEFNTSTQPLRSVLDNYYSESFNKCIKIRVTGKVIESTCPTCVTVYKIGVSGVTVA